MNSNRVSVGLVTFSILATAILFYFSLSTTPVELSQPEPHAVQVRAGRTLAEISRPSFRDATLEYGLTLTHREGDERVTGLDDVIGSGVCVLDYDGDGWMDLFVVNGSGDARYYGKPHWWQHAPGNGLFRNIGGRTFADVTNATGIAKEANAGMGCASADFDNDGDPDLLTTGRNAISLFRNDEGKAFTDVTPQSGLPTSGWFTAIAIADVDGDGSLDLYLGRYVQFVEGAHTYESNSQNKGDNPASFNPALYRAQSNYLFKGVGNLAFTDVTALAGVGNEDGRTYSAVLTDLNNDNKPDLMVTNHAGTGSTKYFTNAGGFKFTESGISSQMQSALGFRGIAVGDIDNNGTPELVLAGESGATSSLFVIRDAEKPGAQSRVFLDEARPRGVAQDRFSSYSQWSPLLADLNNDGHLDLFFTSGSLLPDPDSGRVPLGQPKLLLINKGDGTFGELATERNNPLHDMQSARGAAVADFNNDGALDVFVAHNNDLGQLLLNQSPPSTHWIGIKLGSDKGNRDAIGSVVEIETASAKQTRIFSKTQGFLSDGDSRIHFGTGGDAEISRLTIRWPDGSKTEYRDVPTDAYISIHQQRGIHPLEMSERSRSESSRLKLKLVSDDPENRAAYLDVLLSVYPPEKVFGELAAATTDRFPVVRRHAATLLGAHRTAEGHTALVQMLEDSNSEVAATAVEALCRYEEENSVRWLLRMTGHPSPSVRRALANCFSFFYQEEEAVVHRKYLALPHLIRLLSDGDKSVVIAAANALANSERFRGVESLLGLISAKDEGVSTSALRAIGLIRERSAIEPLVKFLSKNEPSPSRSAHALIALRRLDYDKFEVLLGDYICGRKSFVRVSFSDRVSAALLLAQYEDGLAFARARLLEVAQCLTEKQTLELLDETATLRLIEILNMVSSPNSIETLKGLRVSRYPRARAFSAVGLHEMGVKDGTHDIFESLKDSDPTVVKLVLQQLREWRVPMPASIVLDLLRQPDFALDTVRSLIVVADRVVADALFEMLSSVTTTDELRIGILEALGTSRSFSYTLPGALQQSRNEQVRVAAMKYEFSRLPPLLVSKTPPEFIPVYLSDASELVRGATAEMLLGRQEFWAKNRVLELMHSQSKDDLAIRIRLVQNWPAHYSDVGAVISEMAADRGSPLREYAIDKLLSSKNKSVDDVLIRILNDTLDEPALRFRIARQLATTQGSAVISLMRGQKTVWKGSTAVQ